MTYKREHIHYTPLGRNEKFSTPLVLILNCFILVFT